MLSVRGLEAASWDGEKEIFFRPSTHTTTSFVDRASALKRLPSTDGASIIYAICFL
jgi:hypothetical protein